ncbi:aldo/keto reductase [Paraburkholderia sp. BL9I2N2]|uniref:aldo/keto reductase n=1 Tax=Paraburkholderia sp. BL9I2N2 TaxID=1938809 RepID=UPI001FB31C23|nr:aldo/keto reductase [Paraburkholderia sp. BL9I2N2]
MAALKTQGIELPRVGFGTFRMPRDGCQPVVESALELGYRHIDTAEMYQNEEAVGAAFAALGLGRKQLHLTFKVWHEKLESESLHLALDVGLGKLGVD